MHRVSTSTGTQVPSTASMPPRPAIDTARRAATRRVVDQGAGLMAGGQAAVGQVAAVGEALGDHPQPGRRAAADHTGPRLGHQDPAAEPRHGLDHRGRRRTGSTPIRLYSAPCGLTKVTVPPDGAHLGIEDGPLLDDVVDQLSGRHIDGPPAEPVPVAVRDVGADDDTARQRGLGRGPHHLAVPGVESARQAGAGDRVEDGEIGRGELVALGQIGVEIDRHHASSIEHPLSLVSGAGPRNRDRRPPAARPSEAAPLGRG